MACLDLAGATRLQSVAWARGDNPVTKVVRMLEDMKKEVEAEAKQDEDVYGKMKCWCESNEDEKTRAVAVAQRRISEFETIIERGTSTVAKLKSEISGLKSDIAEGEEAIQAATEIREQERAEYATQEKDMMDTIAALREAIPVLEKVQLVQRPAGAGAVASASLVQLRDLVTRIDLGASKRPRVRAGLYKSVMMKDLWDMMGSLPGGATAAEPPTPRVLTGLEQEQQPTGAAAGAKSYNARSSQILGMLQQMQSDFERDLSDAQREEIEAEIAYQRLKAAKTGEVQSATEAVEQKTAQLAQTEEDVAQAKVALEDTTAALSADEAFLVDLKKRCKTAAGEYGERQASRTSEVAAIAEAIQILSEDDARDVFSKTVTLVQVGSQRGRPGAPTGILLQAKQQNSRAVSKLLAAARLRRGTAAGLSLASLAVGVQLDGFEKVKKMMDKMVAELKSQQAEEVEKHDACQDDVHKNDMAIMEKESEKKDHLAEVKRLEASLAQLADDQQKLKAQLADTQTSIQRAGEDRKAENLEFQQVFADQTQAVAVLKKALDRLREHYDKASLVLLRSSRRHGQEPGAAVPPPPPAGRAYSKNKGAAGVLQIIEKVIQDAQTAIQEARTAEQEAQDAYVELVANLNDVLSTTEEAITENEVQEEKANADKLVNNKAAMAAVDVLKDLDGQKQAIHLDCDYVLRNFNVRQQGRQEEIEAIQQAKAILSGADLPAAAL